MARASSRLPRTTPQRSATHLRRGGGTLSPASWRRPLTLRARPRSRRARALTSRSSHRATERSQSAPCIEAWRCTTASAAAGSALMVAAATAAASARSTAAATAAAGLAAVAREAAT
eukprot:scaffold5798_cov86-Phaeocystis_antarctica.AAC.1